MLMNKFLSDNNYKEQKWEEKQLYGHFKQQTSEISSEKTWAWLKKGNLKRKLNLFLQQHKTMLEETWVQSQVASYQRL